MSELPRVEITPDVKPLVMFLTHNSAGNPSVLDDPQLAVDELVMPYVKHLFGDRKFNVEITPSGNISIILNEYNIPTYSLISSLSSNEDLESWFNRCGEVVEAKPWSFNMGKGVKIPQVGHFVNDPNYEAFNPIIDFLNEKSVLHGWAGGLVNQPRHKSL